MSQANMIPIFMEDQKDHDDTFASRDMSLLSMTSIEYRDATSTSVCPRDMTLVSMVNQSPDNREMTHTSVDIREMMLVSMVNLSPSKNCNALTSDNNMIIAPIIDLSQYNFYVFPIQFFINKFYI